VVCRALQVKFETFCPQKVKENISNVGNVRINIRLQQTFSEKKLMITITMRKCERADITNDLLARTKLNIVETQIMAPTVFRYFTCMFHSN
jgi:hypothetical protein